MKAIAVVMGGYSAEKIISMKSGEVVMNFLDKSLYKPYAIVIDENEWKMVDGNTSYTLNRSDFSVDLNGQKIVFDGVFIAVHGPPGENGILQTYLDALYIPYTSSGAKASELSFDKGKCNDFLRNNGIPCAKSVILKKNETVQQDFLINTLGLPCFVKPNSNGSSFGISKVSNSDELLPAIEKAFTHDDNVLVESFLSGTEVTCGVHNLNGDVQTLPITEIISENDFFDFEAKYEGKSKEITPARISNEIAKKVSERTIEIYKLLNLDGIARIDFIITDGQPFVIEANTVPGLSKESIIPQQAQAMGISLTELFNKAVNHMFEGS
jgi:D-alanine-D-alanine ligase